MFFGLPRFLPSFGGKNFQSWNLVRFHEARFCSTHDVSNCAQTQSVNQVVSGSVTDQVGSVSITSYSRILDPTFCCSISTFLNLNLLGVNPSKPVRFWKRLKGQSRDLQAAWMCWQVWWWARCPILINHGRLSHPSPFWHPSSCLPSRNLHISTHLFAILAGTLPSRHTICPEIAFQGGQVDTNSSRSEMKGWGSTFTMLIRPQICHVVVLIFCLATQDQPDGTQYFRISKPLGSAESWRFMRCIFSLEAVWSSLWSGIAL